MCRSVASLIASRLLEDDLEDYADAADEMHSYEASRQAVFNELTAQVDNDTVVVVYNLRDNRSAHSSFTVSVSSYLLYGIYNLPVDTEKQDKMLEAFVLHRFAEPATNDRGEDVFVASKDFLEFFEECPNYERFIQVIAERERGDMAILEDDSDAYDEASEPLFTPDQTEVLTSDRSDENKAAVAHLVQGSNATPTPLKLMVLNYEVDEGELRAKLDNWKNAGYAYYVSSDVYALPTEKFLNRIDAFIGFVQWLTHNPKNVRVLRENQNLVARLLEDGDELDVDYNDAAEDARLVDGLEHLLQDQSPENLLCFDILKMNKASDRSQDLLSLGHFIANQPVLSANQPVLSAEAVGEKMKVWISLGYATLRGMLGWDIPIYQATEKFDKEAALFKPGRD